MSEADRVFDRFPDFIKEYIFSHGWEELRRVQIEAAKTVFYTDRNLLLTSSTASGKTEAAFFPVLSEIYNNPSKSIAILYIAPLKSLINDQFDRMDQLLSDAGIPVCHWHGDVGMSHKEKLLKSPSGILQITPESLESMLINRSNDIPRLFGDLRYVIIDEIHTLTGSDRGNQIICQLCRIAEKIGYHPRRIGLSATIGDVQKAAAWLGAGSGRETDIPSLTQEKIRWRLGLEHFYATDREAVRDKSKEAKTDATQKRDEAVDVSDTGDAPTKAAERSDGRSDEAKEEGDEGSYSMLDAGYEYLYDCVYGKRALVFSNSREETEYVTATLRQICRYRGDEDVFLIHHGNISAALREQAEIMMKRKDVNAVTCATVTMELGIDIGRLERVAQVGAPNSVSNFLQRLGRSGRRGSPPEMMMVFREEEPLPNTPLPQLIPWELLRAVAVIQLYIEERFIEPPSEKKLPFSLAFQQTLSILMSSGELTPKALAQKLLSLPAFANMPKESYRELLISMIKSDFIELTEEGGLIVGLGGERLTNSFKFYAVFADSEDFTVRCGSDEIGTITTAPPVGDRFALAGRVWEVTELDIQRRLIYVKSVDGKMEISWPGYYGEIHTKILLRMKKALVEDDVIYPYLKPNAVSRLNEARLLAKRAGMERCSLVHLGGFSWCLFPWVGTKAFRAVRRYLTKNSAKFGISGIEYQGCEYISFKLDDNDGVRLAEAIYRDISEHGMDAHELVFSSESPSYDKYDEHVPPALLRDAYAVDRLCCEEASESLMRLRAELCGGSDGTDQKQKGYKNVK